MPAPELPARIRRLLPLDAREYHLLFALHGTPMHGYALSKTLEQRTGGLIRLAPGNLYRVVRRLLREGLVVEARDVVTPAHEDERRKYYRLTELGRLVLAAEADRMRVLVEEAAEARLPQALREALA